MFLGHLQVLFYAIPLYSQLLFCEIGNGPLLEDFDKPLWPWGCIVSKSCIKQKVTVLGYLQVLQVLLYAVPPNSQLLFSQPGKGPLFD